jgi:hypothetical protein
MSQHTRQPPAPHKSPFGDSRLQIARETLKQAGHYLDAGESVPAAQLLHEAERIVIELAREQAFTPGKKSD